MIVLYTIPNRNLSNTTLSTGLLNLSNFVQAENCGGLLLRFELSNVTVGESLIITYSIYVNGEFKSSSTSAFTQNTTGAIGFDVDHKDNTTQLQASVQAIGSIRISATLYSTTPGEDIV